MQDRQDQSHNNIVSLFTPKHAPHTKTPREMPEAADSNQEQVFRDLMKKNADNQKRLRQDRNKANQSVLKSYRIKK